MNGRLVLSLVKLLLVGGRTASVRMQRRRRRAARRMALMLVVAVRHRRTALLAGVQVHRRALYRAARWHLVARRVTARVLVMSVVRHRRQLHFHLQRRRSGRRRVELSLLSVTRHLVLLLVLLLVSRAGFKSETGTGLLLAVSSLESTDTQE